MVTQTHSLQVLDPCPEERPEEKHLSATLPDLQGKIIGLLENRKYHADTFLHEFQTILQREYDVKQVIYTTKFSYSAPCPTETIETLISTCDAIIHGVAD